MAKMGEESCLHTERGKPCRKPWAPSIKVSASYMGCTGISAVSREWCILKASTETIGFKQDHNVHTHDIAPVLRRIVPYTEVEAEEARAELIMTMMAMMVMLEGSNQMAD